VLTQAIAVGSVAIYSATGTAVVLLLVHLLVGLRVDAESELAGLDLAQHREHLGS
jgi:Amt family ammonium transporter